MSLITPTVGRVVWFHPGPGDTAFPNFDRSPGAGPRAAIIAHVWSDHCVNLAVFTHAGVPVAKTSINLLQGDDAAQPGPDHDGWAEWMPYQKGQAAKTEAAERAASEAK